MDDTATRIWMDLVGRLTGPMTFRILLQPTMAALYAVLDGTKDAHEGRLPYFWSIFTHPESRRSLLNEGVHRVGRVILLGVVMDVIYQVIVFRRIYPFELVIVVVLLAFIPYLVLRGPVNRIVQHFSRSRTVT
jgi:Ca2+/Na+ antiporter